MGNEFTIFHYWIMAVSATSLAVAFVALLISWVNARRTNASVLRIIEASGHSSFNARPSTSVPGTPPESYRFAVWVKNLGLPLHQVKSWLRIASKDGSGTIRIEMTRYSLANGHAMRDDGELGKGMVGRFEVRSEDRWMTCFRLPPVETQRYLDIDAAGYRVQSFRIGGWRDGLAKSWNRLAYRINRRFDKRVKTHAGESRLKPGNVLPILRDVDSRLSYFFACLARQNKHDDARPPQRSPSGEDAQSQDPH